jgi:copper chaperone CopZ
MVTEIMNNSIECFVEPVVKPWDPKRFPETMVAYLDVTGMGCGDCEMRVRNGLLNLNGVLLANVRQNDGSFTAIYDPEQVRASDRIQAIENAAGEDGRRFWAVLYFQIPAEQVDAI